MEFARKRNTGKIIQALQSKHRDTFGVVDQFEVYRALWLGARAPSPALSAKREHDCREVVK
jgi:hypothetical protein